MKVLAGLFGVLFVLSVGTAYLADFYFDSLSSEMGDAEYPEESFEAYSNRTSYEIEENVRPENIDDSSLMDRLRLSNTMMLDIVSMDFADLSKSNNNNDQILLGFKTEGYNDIDEGFSQPQFCDELSYYEASIGSWLRIMAYGDLNTTFRNSSKMEEYENTVERIEYYNKKLFNRDGEKRTYISYQNSSGLYIIGEQTDSVEINGTQYSTKINGDWSHADVDLEQGTYNITYSGEEQIFKVFNPTNEAYDEGKLHIRDEYDAYDYVEIVEENSTYSSEIGRNLSRNSSAPEAEIKYVNEDVSITKKVENHDHPENDNSESEQFSEHTGLNTDSAEKVLKAVRVYNKALEVIPFIESRSQKLF